MSPLGWLIVGWLCSASAARAKQCYWNSKEAYTYFATVTPYDDVRGDIRDEPALEGCEPWSLWAMVRHGTRHPSEANAALMKETAALRDDIISNYEAGLGEMCAQDIQDLADWTWDNSLEEEPMYLTKEGWSELQQLGSRVRSRFGALLGSLGAGAALFRPTDSQRTRASARAFVEGLRNDTFDVTDPIERDEVNESYKYCDKYAQEKANDTRFDEEERKLRETDDYQQMLSNTRRRLGISSLSPAQAAGLYHLCRHSRAYAPARRHAWCAVFQQQDLQVLEYIKDLQDHYERGYGSACAGRLGALPLKHLWRSAEAAAAAGAAAAGARRVEGYFTHDSMLQMVLTALGLFRDFPPVSGLRVEPGRKWRTSLMTPFASNVIVLVNKCEVNGTASELHAHAGDAGGSPAAHAHLVQVFVNEHLVPLCGARACAWPQFREMMLPFANTTMDFCALTST